MLPPNSVESIIFDKAISQLNAGRDWLYVTVPKKVTGRLRMVVLSNPRVTGEVMSENSEGHAVLLVKASDVVRWFEAQRK